MKLVYLPLKDLVPYENNPRRHPEEQVVALMKAITEFGFDQPIVVTPNNVIIKGHGRFEAAKRLGLDVVPVVVKAITETEAKFLRVVDNEVVSKDWDYHALSTEADALQAQGFDLEATGFTVDALSDLLDSPGEHAATETQPATYSVPPTPKRTCKHCGYKF